MIFHDEIKYINTNEANRLIINITLVIKDIWRLESKWSDHDRFWTDHDRMLAEVSNDFFLNFTCAHKHSRQRSYKKVRKNAENLRNLRKNPETSAEERAKTQYN